MPNESQPAPWLPLDSSPSSAGPDGPSKAEAPYTKRPKDSAQRTTRSMPIKRQKALASSRKTEYGIYGLLAANGLGEAATGKDMFGNQLTEEQRQNGLLMALGIGGVAGAAKVADKVASGTKYVPYSKEFAQKQVQKVQATITDIARSGKTTIKNIGEEIGNNG